MQTQPASGQAEATIQGVTGVFESKGIPLMIGQMSSDADQGIKNLIGGANSGDSKKTGTEELQAIQGA